MGFILFNSSDLFLDYKKGQPFSKRDEDRLVEAYYKSTSLTVNRSIKNLGIQLSSKKYIHKNVNLINKFINRNSYSELKFLISLNPSLPANYSMPCFRNARIFNLFKNYVNSKGKDIQFYPNDSVSVVNLFFSSKFILKHVWVDYTKAFLKFLEIRKMNHEVDPATYDAIKSRVDTDKLFQKYPMIEMFMDSDKILDHMHAKALSRVFQQGNLSTPRITDFLSKTVGLKSSSMVKKFTSSHKKSYLAVFGAMLKKAFVDTNKANYAIELLGYPINDRLVNLMIYFPQTFDAMISILSPEQFKTLLTEMVVNKRLISSDFHTIRDSIDLFSEHKLFIDTKFSNINTVAKFAKYLNGKTMKEKNPIYDLFLHLPQVHEQSLSNNLQLILPKTNHDLIDWGLEMKNCLGYNSYDLAIQDGHCCMIGVKKEGKLSYCIEISFGEIRSALGHMNSKMDKDDFNIVKDYLKPILVPFNKKPFTGF